jgi:chromosomal replication initiation ATPase DnaA
MNSSTLSFPRGPIFPYTDGSKTLASFWQETLADLSNRIGQAPVIAWLQGVRPLKVDIGVVTVAAPTSQVQDWISVHLAPAVQETFRALGCPDLRLRVVVQEEASAEPLVIDRSRSFESYAVGSENREAVFALRSILEDRDRPGVLISGPAGSGKTHLMFAAGWQAFSRGRTVAVRSLNGDEPMLAVPPRQQPAEEIYFRAQPVVPLTLWDNLNLRALHYREQERLAFELIECQENGGQVVLVIDGAVDTRAPMHFRLAEVLHPLRSVSLANQGFALRESTLKLMLAQRGVVIPSRLIQFLAALSPSDAHVMDASVREIAEITRRGSRLEADDVVRLAGRAARRYIKVPPRAILRTVMETYGCSLAALIGHRRNRRLDHLRYLTMYLLRTESGVSSDEIGAILGGRGHSCVAYGCSEVDRLRGTFSGRQEVESLRRTLTQDHTPIPVTRV